MAPRAEEVGARGGGVAVRGLPCRDRASALVMRARANLTEGDRADDAPSG